MPQAFVIQSPSEIYPGGTTRVVWGVCPDDGGPPAPSVTVQIYIDGQLVFPLSGSLPVPAATGGSLTLNRAQLNDAHVDLRGFYRVGISS